MHQLPRRRTHIMRIIEANNYRRFLNAIVLVINIITGFAENLASKIIIILVLIIV